MQSSIALVLIDVQKGFYNPSWGRRNNPGFEKNIAELLALGRHAGLHVLHVQHQSVAPMSPLRSDRAGCEFMECAKPVDEVVFTKSVNSAFIGTELEAYLRRVQINSLLLAGLTSDHCVSTTARMAANLGFQTTIVQDATATFDRRGPDDVMYEAELIHKVSMASLHGEFATVVNLEEIRHRFGRCL